MKHLLLLTAIFFCGLQISNAQPGELDPSFGDNGIVKTEIGLGSPVIYSSSGIQALTQTNGSVYLVFRAGNFTLITKKHMDGSTDVTYGNNGFSVAALITPASAVMQTDGKIVVTGSVKGTTGSSSNQTDAALARFNTDGSLDKTFSGGIVSTESARTDAATCIAIQSDGKIVIAGWGEGDGFNGYILVARYNSDGSPDNTFGIGGVVINDLYNEDDKGETARSIAIRNDGKIVLLGNTSEGRILIRYNSDGSFDNTFNGNGKKPLNNSPGLNSLLIDSDEKMILAGSSWNGSDNDFAIFRFNADGSPDNTFDGDGAKTINFGYDDQASSMAFQLDGKIIIAGTTNNNTINFAIARCNTDGSPDNTFSGDGKQITDFGPSTSDYLNSIAVQKDGKIIVSGYTIKPGATSVAAARYNTDGTPDNSFNDNGTLSFIYSERGATVYKATAVQSDGKVIAAGYGWNGSNYDFVVVRYNIDGSLDKTFSDDGIQVTDFNSSNDYANAVVIQPDGKILAAGSAGNDFAIARYNTNGSPDNTFDLDGLKTTDFGLTESITKILLQADGKILACGSAILRYNADGSTDNSFNGNGRVPRGGSDLAIQNDGKIIISGDDKVTRYNIDGSIDVNFGDEGELDLINDESPLYDPDWDFHSKSILIQSDGKILIGGDYEFANREIYGEFAVMRLNADWSFDESFDEDGIVFTGFGNSSYATCMAIQSDNKIIAAGYSLWVGDNFSLVRYNPDGSLDTTFSGEGIQVTEASATNDRIHSIAISGNKLYAAGYGQFPGNFGIVARYLLDNEETQIPPVVTLSNPSHDTTYIGPLDIKLAATASDADGTISRVEFYSGETLLATERKLPYAWTWKNVTVGEYILTAKAYDNDSLVTTSAPVHITVVTNQPPVVSITSPADNTAYLTPATVFIKASAKDADGKIKKVEFYNGETLLGTDKYAGYGWHWNDVPPGDYILTAKAYDNYGDVSTSEAVHITVALNKAPTVSLITPANHQTFTAAANIHLEASAKDPDGAISKVVFYSGETILATERKVPYTFNWKNVEAGEYTLTAKATDNSGVEVTSAVVNISVIANVAPTVSIINPANEESFTAPATIEIKAIAKDADGTISKVEFYEGARLLRTERYLGYSWKWKEVAAGTYTITAKATDNLGAETISSPVTVIVESPEAPLARGKVSEALTRTNINAAISLKLSPNPVHNILNITAEGLEGNKTSILSVLSSSGALIKTMRTIIRSTQPLDVSSLAKGIYTIRIQSGDKIIYRKFVKL